jgi:hypothetical protein
MTTLRTTANLPRPDEAYAALVAAQEGLDAEASAAFMTRLALILANHIGDPAVLGEAIALARRAGAPGEAA